MREVRRSHWLKIKGQPRNEKGQFTSRGKSADKTIEMHLSMISNFNCYINSDAKLVHTITGVEIQIDPKETNLARKTGIISEQIHYELTSSVRKSKRIPFAKQTGKMGRVPQYTRKKTELVTNRNLLQGNQAKSP